MASPSFFSAIAGWKVTSQLALGTLHVDPRTTQVHGDALGDRDRPLADAGVLSDAFELRTSPNLAQKLAAELALAGVSVGHEP